MELLSPCPSYSRSSLLQRKGKCPAVAPEELQHLKLVSSPPPGFGLKENKWLGDCTSLLPATAQTNKPLDPAAPEFKPAAGPSVLDSIIEAVMSMSIRSPLPPLEQPSPSPPPTPATPGFLPSLDYCVPSYYRPPHTHPPTPLAHPQLLAHPQSLALPPPSHAFSPSHNTPPPPPTFSPSHTLPPPPTFSPSHTLPPPLPPSPPLPSTFISPCASGAGGLSCGVMPFPPPPATPQTPPLCLPSPSASSPLQSPSSRVLMLSRSQLHNMLFDLVSLGCERQALRWDRGEDLIELEQKEAENAVTDFELNGKDRQEKRRLKKKEKREKKRVRRLAVRKIEKSCVELGQVEDLHRLLEDRERDERLQSYRAEHLGILVSSIKTEWSKWFTSYLSLDVYMGYFGMKRLKQLLQEVPNVAVIGKGGFMRIATNIHVARYASALTPPSTAAIVTEDFTTTATTASGVDTPDLSFREHLVKLVHALVCAVCQEQHALHLLATAQGVSDSAAEEDSSRPEEEIPEELRTIMAQYAEEAEAIRVKLLARGVRGLAVSNLRKEWLKMLKTPLQPLLLRAGYFNVCDLLADVPNIRVVGTRYGDLRCLVCLRIPKMSVTDAIEVIQQAAVAQADAMSKLVDSSE